MPAVLDLVGNLFNVQSPGDLDGAISLRLAAIVTPGAAGPSVDLDALLLMLVREYSGGNCPRAPLLFPRRLTDGKLFNIFNTAGHNTHVETLKSQNATKFIGASAAKGVSVGTGSRPGTTSSSIMSPGTPPQLLGSPKATLLQPYGPLAPTDAHSARSFQAGPGGAGGPLPQGSALQHDQAAAFAAEMDEPVETLRSGLSSGSMTVRWGAWVVAGPCIKAGCSRWDLRESFIWIQYNVETVRGQGRVRGSAWPEFLFCLRCAHTIFCFCCPQLRDNPQPTAALLSGPSGICSIQQIALQQRVQRFAPVTDTPVTTGTVWEQGRGVDGVSG